MLGLLKTAGVDASAKVLTQGMRCIAFLMSFPLRKLLAWVRAKQHRDGYNVNGRRGAFAFCSASLYSARFELEKARERASFCSKSHFCNELGHRV